jgi:hypothetical protein
MNLTEHFTLEEMLVTQHREIDNSPNDEVMANIFVMAGVLEMVRTILNVPMIITSGYRCPDLNIIVGGRRGSKHMLGLAADFIAPAFGPPIDVCRAIIASGIEFDQIIYEHTWTHFGWCEKGDSPRREIFTYLGPETYARGLVDGAKIT